MPTGSQYLRSPRVNPSLPDASIPLQYHYHTVFALGVHLVLKLTNLLQYLLSLLLNFAFVPFLIKCGEV